MVGRFFRLLGLICVATVMTQIILVAFLTIRGSINRRSVTQHLALVNGIDISGRRLQSILREDHQREQPSFEEILHARTMASLDMDLRETSQTFFQDELTKLMSDVRAGRQRLDNRLDSFRRELDEAEAEALDQGIRDATRTIANLEAESAKNQLLIMYDDQRIDDVVTIIQALPSEKRKDILAEFESPDESLKLAEILRLIGEGRPTTTMIDQARIGSNRDGPQ